jgi:hypothetical protein
MPHKQLHPFSSEDKALVASALEPDQLTGEKKKQLPRRRLTGIEVLILWGLRVYLIFMVAVVVYQIWSGTH